MEEAVRRARAATGPCPYATTIHAINSALIKVARITPLPPGAKVYRGMAGVKMTPRFLHPNEFGSRVGNEVGFMSTTTKMEVAIGYMDEAKPHKQLFEINVAQIDHGADIDFLSLFPGEKEMLFPPNACLEVVGAARVEHTSKGLILVWPLSININLGGRTIQDFQGTRKELLLEAAESEANEVQALLVHFKALPTTRDRMAQLGNDDEQSVDRMLRSVWEQSLATLHSLRKRPQEHYNDDANYKVAYEEVTDLKSLAASVLDLWASEYKPWDAWSLCSISLHEARQSLAEQMAKELAEVKCAGPADEARVRALAGKLARLRKFFARDLEAPDPEGLTALLRWCHEGYLLAVSLLLDAGADFTATTRQSKETGLQVAVRQGHIEVVREWVARKLPLDAQEHRGETALYHAADTNKLEILSVLVEGGAALDLACCDEEETALYAAAVQGHAEAVRVLARGGARLDAAPKEGFSPLRTAIERRRAEMQAVLLDLGAKDLHSAARLDDPVMVQHCLADGALPDTLDHAGRSAMEVAVESDAAQAVRALLEANASLQLHSHAKHALRSAAEREAKATVAVLRASGAADLHAAAILDDALMVQDCLKRGVDPNAPDHEGVTALWLAAKHDAADACTALAKGGAALNAKSSKGGRTALREAVEGKHHAALAALRASGAADVHSGALLDDAAMIRAALEAGADVDEIDAQGQTALLIAARGDAGEAVRALAEGGARLDLASGRRKETALFVALERGETRAVAALVACGAKDLTSAALLNDSNMANQCLQAGSLPDEPAGRRAVAVAVEKGSREVVALLLEAKADIDAQDKKDETLLHGAVRWEQQAVLEELLRQGADTELLSDDGTALQMAAGQGSEAMVEALLAGGARTDTLDEGQTALHRAAEKGHARVVTVLLRAGADPHLAPSRSKRTALHVAVAEEQVESVRALLEGGAGPDVQDSGGKTPLHMAVAQGSVEVMAALLAAGASTELADKDGRTAAFLAVEEGHLEALHALLAAGAHIGLSPCGSAPLNEALLQGQDAMADALLDAHAPIHLADEETGNTALMIAAYFGKTPFVERLLELRADVNIKSKEGKSALRYAVEQGNTESAALLRQSTPEPRRAAPH